MQTFVPWPDFNESASVLDNKRLNKQLLEGRQIYGILVSGRRSGAWVNHPAVKMWRNYDMALFEYLEAIKDECIYRNIQTKKNWDAIMDIHNNNWNRGSNTILPPWWDDDRIHLSHRQNLYKKDSEYYAYFVNDNRLSAVSCCDTCSYFWPVAGHAKEYTPDPNWQKDDPDNAMAVAMYIKNNKPVDKSLLINLDW